MKNKANQKTMLAKRARRARRARRAKRKEAMPAERRHVSRPRMSPLELQHALNRVGLELVANDTILMLRKIPGWIEPTEH